MSGAIAVLIAAAVIVLGGVGLYRVAYSQGYAQAYEDLQDGIVFTPDDEGD